MSRVYENGYRIEYPNELAYAGMPMIIKVSNAGSYIGVGITIKVGEDYHAETRTLYNGEVTFDIQRYAQMAFVGKDLGYKLVSSESWQKSNLSQYIEVVVSLTDSAGVTTNAATFDITALYGYIGIYQTNGASVRKRKWFYHYPQSFDFYGNAIGGPYLVVDGGGVASWAIPNSENIEQTAVFINYRMTVLENTKRKAELTAYNTWGINGDNVVNIRTTYDLDIVYCTSGVYLRWLDHLGQWCYYLFRPTGRNYTTKEVQSWQDGILRNSLAPENGVYLQSGQTMHQYSQQESISLGAKLVDAETFDFLLTLTHSPVVEVLANASDYVEDPTTTPLWERVSVVGGSYARTSAPLQDFSVSIIRNAQTSQML